MKYTELGETHQDHLIFAFCLILDLQSKRKQVCHSHPTRNAKPRIWSDGLRNVSQKKLSIHINLIKK